MKRISILLLKMLALICIAEEDSLHMMVQGKYLLVGKGLDSESAYHGKVEIEEKDGKLAFSRVINCKTTNDVVAIESVLHGNAKVLRIRLTEGETKY